MPTTIEQAVIEVDINASKFDKKLNDISNKARQKLSNVENKVNTSINKSIQTTSDKLANQIPTNWEKSFKIINRGARKIETIFRKTNAGISIFGGLALRSFLKSDEGKIFGGQLNKSIKEWKDAYAAFGGKLAESNIFGKNISEWLKTASSLLNKMSQEDVQKLIDGFSKLAVLATGLLVTLQGLKFTIGSIETIKGLGRVGLQTGIGGIGGINKDINSLKRISGAELGLEAAQTGLLGLGKLSPIKSSYFKNESRNIGQIFTEILNLFKKFGKELSNIAIKFGKELSNIARTGLFVIFTKFGKDLVNGFKGIPETLILMGRIISFSVSKFISNLKSLPVSNFISNLKSLTEEIDKIKNMTLSKNIKIPASLSFIGRGLGWGALIGILIGAIKEFTKTTSTLELLKSTAQKTSEGFSTTFKIITTTLDNIGAGFVQLLKGIGDIGVGLVDFFKGNLKATFSTKNFNKSLETFSNLGYFKPEEIKDKGYYDVGSKGLALGLSSKRIEKLMKNPNFNIGKLDQEYQYLQKLTNLTEEQSNQRQDLMEKIEKAQEDYNKARWNADEDELRRINDKKEKIQKLMDDRRKTLKEKEDVFKKDEEYADKFDKDITKQKDIIANAQIDKLKERPSAFSWSGSRISGTEKMNILQNYKSEAEKRREEHNKKIEDYTQRISEANEQILEIQKEYTNNLNDNNIKLDDLNSTLSEINLSLAEIKGY